MKQDMILILDLGSDQNTRLAREKMCIRDSNFPCRGLDVIHGLKSLEPVSSKVFC